MLNKLQKYPLSSKTALLLKACLIVIVAISQTLNAADKKAKNLITNGDFEGGEVVDMPWTGFRNGNIGLDLNGLWTNHNISRVEAVGPDGFLIQNGLSMAPGIAVGDLDGDGLGDLMLADPSGRFFFFKNIGTPNEPKFGRAESMPIYIGSNILHGHGHEKMLNMPCPKFQLIDVNNDGALDLVIGDFLGKLMILKNQGSKNSPNFVETNGYEENAHSKFEISTTNKNRYWGNFFAPFYADMNGDGILDVVIGEGTYASNSIWLLKNNGSNATPLLDAKKRLLAGLGKMFLCPQIVDWNGDGKPDIVVGSMDGDASGSGSLLVYLNQSAELGDLKFGAGQSVGTLKPPGKMVTPYFYDLNGDGLADLIFTCAEKESVFYSKNVGTKNGWKFSDFVPLKSAATIPKICVPKFPMFGYQPKSPFSRFCFAYLATRNDQYKNLYGYDPKWEPPTNFDEEVMKKNKSSIAFEMLPIKQDVFKNVKLYHPATANETGAHLQTIEIVRGLTYALELDQKGEGLEEITISIINADPEAVESVPHETLKESFSPSTDWAHIKKTFSVSKGDPKEPGYKSAIPQWVNISFKGTGKFMLDNLAIYENY